MDEPVAIVSAGHIRRAGVASWERGWRQGHWRQRRWRQQGQNRWSPGESDGGSTRPVSVGQFRSQRRLVGTSHSPGRRWLVSGTRDARRAHRTGYVTFPSERDGTPRSLRCADTTRSDRTEAAAGLMPHDAGRQPSSALGRRRWPRARTRSCVCGLPVSGVPQGARRAVLLQDHPRQCTIALLNHAANVHTVPVGEVHRSAVRWLHG